MFLCYKFLYNSHQHCISVFQRNRTNRIYIFYIQYINYIYTHTNYIYILIYINNIVYSPGRVAQLVEMSSCTPIRCGFDPGSRHMPRLHVQSLLQAQIGGN